MYKIKFIEIKSVTSSEEPKLIKTTVSSLVPEVDKNIYIDGEKYSIIEFYYEVEDNDISLVFKVLKRRL